MRVWPSSGGSPGHRLRRPCGQGGRAGGAPRARAPCGLRAAIRGRTQARLKARARNQDSPTGPPTRPGYSRCAMTAWSRCWTPGPDSWPWPRASRRHIEKVMEGSRPLLVEVQALVPPPELVPPRRVVAGLVRNRVALVLAVLTGKRGDQARQRQHVGPTSSAACASMSRGPIWPWRWQWPPRPSASRSPGDDERPLGLLRRARAHRRAAKGGDTGIGGWPRPGALRAGARGCQPEASTRRCVEMAGPALLGFGAAAGVRTPVVPQSVAFAQGKTRCDTRASVRIPIMIAARKGLKETEPKLKS